MHPLILASSSPRRKELLQFLHVPFQTIHANVDENFDPNLTAEEAVRELAVRKAAAVALEHKDSCVIGADTVVVVDGEFIGKPADRSAAKQTLQILSGRTHYVYTGVAIIQDKNQAVFAEKTEVSFWRLSDEEIEAYLETGEPFDKAGSYGIQGYGSLLVKEITGDYYTVVGLPVSRLARELKAFQRQKL
ncbi:septum formation inhibitor Maf [Peribacillus cavernae]|uniref:dTTP/UTP pyrophosphatase n=1 Tax=Peribacillus cavernae TaxID=1674310 RepID=A0A3S0W4W6_9BACI|nr:Maf family protein [Peribacillus cavernae]MDQ0219376.1 septum formation protein [Peribacillus cavernae]RUQ27748.1 septum formation inhibitor Maf [Peribacillus cavernae]